MVATPETSVAQAAVLASMPAAINAAVMWPWDRLDEIAGDGAPWPATKDALLCAGFDTAELSPRSPLRT